MTVLPRIERFLHRTAMSPTMFGRRAVNDPRLVFDMRNGRQPRDRMIARIEAFLVTHAGKA
jgi:hypothetical protein